MRLAALFFTVSVLVAPAYAHDAKGAHGGAIVDAGNYHLELVAKGQAVEVFVTDSGDKPVAVEGFKGTAILLIEGKPQRIVLSPATANRLTGNATVNLPRSPKGAVQLQTATGTSIQGKF